MAKVTFKFENFNVSKTRCIQHSNGEQTIDVTFIALLKSYISLGKSSFKQTTIKEALTKFLFISQYLDFRKGGIRLKGFFYNFDPTEKSFVAYNLGMLLTKFVSEKFFGLRHLFYVTQKKIKVVPPNPNRSRSKPDLVGMFGSGYYLFEAKGSLNSRNDGLRTARRQLNNVKTINGSASICKIAVIQFFKKGELYARVVDPIGIGQREIEFNDEERIKLFYESVIFYLNSKETEIIVIGNDRYIVNKIYNFYVGLDIRLFERYSNSSLNDNKTHHIINSNYFEKFEYAIGNDGIFVGRKKEERNCICFN